MVRTIQVLMCLAVVLAAPAQVAAQQPFDLEQSVIDSLQPQGGTVLLKPVEARLDLGSDYVFYSPADTRKILVELWDNAPMAAEGALGLVMPAGSDPRVDGWGALITFQPVGRVVDTATSEAENAILLAQMQALASEDNARRRAQGAPAIMVTGWAQAPRYDRIRHTVSWASELDVADSEVNTLNFDLRVLGRRGVLSLNIVSSIDQLHRVSRAADDLAARVTFAPGARYDDFDEAEDSRSGIGMAALIAGGAGLALAKHSGLAAIALKFAWPIVIGLSGLLALALLSLRQRLRR